VLDHALQAEADPEGRDPALERRPQRARQVEVARDSRMTGSIAFSIGMASIVRWTRMPPAVA
jgi:hypothetical protein